MTTRKTLTPGEAREKLKELDDLGVKLASFDPPHRWSTRGHRWYDEATAVLRSIADGETVADTPAYVESVLERFGKAREYMREHVGKLEQLDGPAEVSGE